MMRRTARLWVGGNVHGDVGSAQDATVERDNLLSKKPCVKEIYPDNVKGSNKKRDPGSPKHNDDGAQVRVSKTLTVSRPVSPGVFIFFVVMVLMSTQTLNLTVLL